MLIELNSIKKDMYVIEMEFKRITNDKHELEKKEKACKDKLGKLEFDKKRLEDSFNKLQNSREMISKEKHVSVPTPIARPAQSIIPNYDSIEHLNKKTYTTIIFLSGNKNTPSKEETR